MGTDDRRPTTDDRSDPDPVRLASADLNWTKATASNGTGGNCLEVAQLPNHHVAVRDSKHPEQQYLIFTQPEFSAFVDGAKAGEFDTFTRRL
ncbi:hypothetical protein ABH920_009476 [Catenulispora sp. EB89]|uniref:DUF397 domain-containing protein n=1 Tax=Catenulispora sp. EB89 TaxID=3156257 RepID=UPI003517211E